VSSFGPSHAPCHDVLPHDGPETMESGANGLKPLKL
jgi:hypothetical protein